MTFVVVVVVWVVVVKGGGGVPFGMYMEKLRKAEEYLSMLESEDRSVATNDWLPRFHSVVASDTTTNNPKEKRNGDEEKEKEGTCHNNNTEDGPSEPQPQWDTHVRTSLSPLVPIMRLSHLPNSPLLRHSTFLPKPKFVNKKYSIFDSVTSLPPKYAF